MGKIPILKPQEVVHILNNLGFVEVRQLNMSDERCFQLVYANRAFQYIRQAIAILTINYF